MCEFCTKHGEGMTQYLVMKNYSADLLHARLSATEQQIVAVEPALCFGCGVCRDACPNDAIELVARETQPAAAGLWH